MIFLISKLLTFKESHITWGMLRLGSKCSIGERLGHRFRSRKLRYGDGCICFFQTYKYLSAISISNPKRKIYGMKNPHSPAVWIDHEKMEWRKLHLHVQTIDPGLFPLIPGFQRKKITDFFPSIDVVLPSSRVLKKLVF